MNADNVFAQDCAQYVRSRWPELQEQASTLARTHQLGPGGKSELLSELYVALRRNWGHRLYLAPTDDRNAYSFRTMFGIARRMRIAALKDQKRCAPLPEATAGTVPDQLQRDDQLAEMIIDVALRDRLVALIAALPDEEHAVLTLIYRFGYTQATVSKELGLSCREVSRTVQRATAQFRAVLAAEEYDVADLRGGAR